MNEIRRRTEREGVANDLDEDLFDFASVARGSEALATEREPGVEDDAEDLDQVLASIRDTQAVEEAARAAAVRTAPAPVAPRPPVPERSGGEAAPVRPRAPARPMPQASTTLPPEPSRSVLAPRRRSTGLIAVVLAVTVLNSALAVVALRPAAPAAPKRQDVVLSAPPPALEPTLADAPVRAHPVLDEAWADLARGEYAPARQRAYGLLALVDGIEGAERDVIVADCRYLIAQALTLEALSHREAAP